jgi:hypothetical protein
MLNAYSFLNICYILSLLYFKSTAFMLPINYVNGPNNMPDIKMGCDYYIYKILRIYYVNEPFRSDIELSREPGYYYDSFIDEDESNYESQIEEHYSQQHVPLMRPILVYINNSFTSNKLENKYNKTIEERIFNDKQQFKNIIKILKIEESETRF